MAPKPRERFVTMRGVRVHNLKGIDLDLPLDRLVVITGVSGAGKSSLAFDTLHAEGRRRYVETFSPSTRQFLETVEKPDADRIDGVPPSIAITRSTRRKSGRSTVGTMTDIHDSLCLIYARAGCVMCLDCGSNVLPGDAAGVVRAIEALPDRSKYLIAFPIDIGERTDTEALAGSVRAAGFVRVRADGSTHLIQDGPLPRPAAGPIDVIVDRLVKGTEDPGRRVDSIETALEHGLGRCRLIVGDDVIAFHRGWRCARCGRDHLGPEPRLFRFQSPLGACPTCEGLGHVIDKDAREARTDRAKVRVSLARGREQAICPACRGARLRPEALAVQLDGKTIAELSAMPIGAALRFLERTASAFDLAGLRAFEPARRRLAALERVGLGHLTLDRPARTLSTGESRRVALTAALGSGLVRTLHILDEPSTGLHPSDVAPVIEALKDLRDAGNSVVMVEHDEALVRAADLMIDIGPGAGEAGGRLLHVGPPAAVVDVTESATGKALARGTRAIAPTRRRPADKGRIELRGASGHNLKAIDVSFPLGVFCVVTGVSGSGKSTLIEETLHPALLNHIKNEHRPSGPYRELTGLKGIDDVVLVDAAPIGRLGRSNPVTFLKAFDEVRKAFAETHEAKLRGYGPSRFSFNVPGGRCDACEGNGYQTIDMQFLADVITRCPECRGRRFRAETLEVTYRGKTIAEVLEMTARQAFGFFHRKPRVQGRLRPLLEVGLDYLRLGQPAATLSGGEAQRLKLAKYLSTSSAALAKAASGPKTLFLLDEPTTGLHPADVTKLLEALNALVDRGNSLIVIEHDPAVMLAADWIIDLGPGAGESGGEVVTQGTPEDVAKSGTATAEVLCGLLAR